MDKICFFERLISDFGIHSNVHDFNNLSWPKNHFTENINRLSHNMSYVVDNKLSYGHK